MQDLIARIQARAHDPALATDEGHGICDSKGNPVVFVANPPLSEPEVAQWEQGNGFALPPLLRALYMQVGDGGFGPGYGLYRLKECLVTHPTPLLIAGEASRYLEICHWGCGITSFVDCGKPGVPVYRHDPNQTETDPKSGIAFYADADYGVIYPEYDTLEGWLEAWVSGQELFFAAYGVDPADFEDAEA